MVKFDVRKSLFQVSLFSVLIFFMENCCSIIIPPVTLTGNKTAIEKQIIGPENELEKDVWMISSAKTTSHASLDVETKKEAEKRQEDTFAYEALAILDHFRENLRQLKADRIVGENNKGLISNLRDENVEIADEIRKKYNPELADDYEKGLPIRTLTETVKQINIAREMLIKGYIENQKLKNPSYKPDMKELNNLQKQKYQEAALQGEYVQNDAGKWNQKR